MFIEIAILSQLMNVPCHGYEIKKKLEKYFGPYYKINNNQLYPKLHALEKKGCVVKKVEVQEGKPDRHIYHVTDPGIQYFHQLLQTFPEEYAANENEYLNRIGHFDLLDENAQKDILTKRKKVILLEYEHMDYLTELHSREKYVPYSKEYFQFSQNSIINELAVIDELLNKPTMS